MSEPSVRRSGRRPPRRKQPSRRDFAVRDVTVSISAVLRSISGHGLALAANYCAATPATPRSITWRTCSRLIVATGVRLGEACALRWSDVDFDRQLVSITSMWFTRRDNAAKDLRPDVTPVFPAPLGGLRDRSNTQADLRDAFEAAGVASITSHVLRKTTATLLDSAGLSAREIADQLGQPSRV